LNPRYLGIPAPELPHPLVGSVNLSYFLEPNVVPGWTTAPQQKRNVFQLINVTISKPINMQGGKSHRLSLIFKGEHLDKVLAGVKTQTRRSSYPKVKIGQTVRLRRGYSKPLQEAIVIKGVYTQILGEITENDVVKEGFKTRDEFIEAWSRLYGSWAPGKSVWVIDFVLAEG
jgi:hypothetical protein